MIKTGLTPDELSAIRREIGRKGGRETVNRHGHEHMRTIGKRGAAVFWQRYTLYPMRLNDFAVIRRDNGEFVASLNGYRPPKQ